ncbi:MAG: hypothetical protein IKB86_07095 [Clostridia bacterium]|nr:hypothetical protein [Clostridia bacterium]
MTKRERQNALYAAVEKAVATKSELTFPEAVKGYSVEVMQKDFLLPELYWMDEKRNVYQVWCRIETRSKLGLPGLFVVGSVTLDGFSSGDLSMITPKTRYQTIV